MAKTKYLCSVYDNRPESCRKYPWNFSNSIFSNCIFYDAENKKLRTHEEQLEMNSEKEISDYCTECGACCYFGPAPCEKLRIIEVEDDEEKKSAVQDERELANDPIEW